MRPTAASLLLAGVVLVSACGHDRETPTTPTTIIQVPPIGPTAPAQTTPYHLSGVVVDEDNAPIGGATVIVRPFIPGVFTAPQVTTPTEPSGAYRITFGGRIDTGSERILGFVDTDVPGHEPDHQLIRASGNGEAKQDLHVRRILRITAGDSVEVSVSELDALCSIDDLYNCRIIRIVAPSAGKLTILASSGAPIPEVLTDLEALSVPYPCCAQSQTFSVSVGELTVHVLNIIPSDQRYTLRTSLSPVGAANSASVFRRDR